MTNLFIESGLPITSTLDAASRYVCCDGPTSMGDPSPTTRELL